VSSMHERLPDTCVTAAQFMNAVPQPKRAKQAKEKFVQDVRNDLRHHGDGSDSEEDAITAADAYLTAKIKAIIAKTKDEREKLETYANLEKKVGGIKQEGGLVVGNSHAGEIVDYKQLLSGRYVRDETDKLVLLSRVLRAFQIRDRHSRERDKRFWVGRLRSFQKAAKEGHDVTLGTCLLVSWGGAKSFAVVRVMGIIEDTERQHSVKLNKKSRTQIFKAELLDPVGAPTEAGSQKYRGSGFSLPKLAATLVLRIVELRHLHALAGIREEVHDALLCVEDIVELYNQGYVRVTKQEGLIHMESDAEKLQNLDQGVMWNANRSELVCLQCVSSWYDDSTGLILKCKSCEKCYHQDCHAPKVPMEDANENWECCVCSGVESEFCSHCREFWDDEDNDNRLMFCEGGCGRLWHQKCYDHFIQYPADDNPWICDVCQLRLTEEEEAEYNQTEKKRKCKQLKKGSQKLQMAVDGKKVNRLVISDKPGTHLEQATWAQKYTHGSGIQKGRGRGRGRGRASNSGRGSGKKKK